MQEIDILRLDRLQQRRKTGQEVAEIVFALGSIAMLLAYGGRAMLALVVGYVVLSLVMFRGYRWAGLAFYGLAFAFVVIMLGLFGYDAFFTRGPPICPYGQAWSGWRCGYSTPWRQAAW